MISAVKSKAFERIFTLYNHYYLLRRRFRSFTFSGSLDPQVLDGNGRLQPMAPDQPVVYFMNHSSWWDGLLLYHAAKQTSRGDHYVMMEERQLRQYAFFASSGRIQSTRTVHLVFGHRCNIQGSCWLLAKGLDFPAGRNSASGGSADSVSPGYWTCAAPFPAGCCRAGYFMSWHGPA